MKVRDLALKLEPQTLIAVLDDRGRFIGEYFARELMYEPHNHDSLQALIMNSNIKETDIDEGELIIYLDEVNYGEW